MFSCILVRAYPCVAGSMHTMRTAIYSSRHRGMASITLGNSSAMALHRNALGIIVGM